MSEKYQVSESFAAFDGYSLVKGDDSSSFSGQNNQGVRNVVHV